MTAAVAVLGLMTLSPSVELPTMVWGIAPKVEAAELPRLKKTKDKAVILVHGLQAHVFKPALAEKPEAHKWQKADADLVKALTDEFDVFGVSYAQTVLMDLVPMSKALREGVASIRAAGYKEIAMVGHSAGGVIIRRFLECHPDTGVTKVVAVASPFDGSIWANLPGFVIPKPQEAFIGSMLPDIRKEWRARCSTVLPKDIQFCCIVCKLPRLAGDTVVSAESQWPESLRKQGIPVVAVRSNHFAAMTGEKPIAAIVDVLKGTVKRWDEKQVLDAKRSLIGLGK